MEEVLILGSRFTPKSPLETTVPVDVIMSEEITQMGYWKLSDLLQYLAPSFHSTQQSISDGTDHINPATMKGLGPDQVLVMINGRRRHNSSLVNVNGTVGRGSVGTDMDAIPVSAIERIEILRDGAAAQYGSDAIAGVINIILKGGRKGGDIQIQTGATSEGDGGTFSLIGAYGMKTGERGFVHISTQISQSSPINRSGNYTGLVYGDERDNDSTALSSFFAQTTYKDRRVMSIGGAGIGNFGVFVNSDFALKPSTSLYAFGGFNYKLGKAAGFYRFPYQKSKQSGLFDYGFSPQIWTDIFDYSLSVGLKTIQRGWTVDISNTFGQNGFDFTVKNSNNASMGLNSPTTAYSGGFNYRQNVFDVDVTKKFAWSIPFHIAMGGAFRIENYQQIEGDEASWQFYGDTLETGGLKEAGFQLFPGFRPENSIRKIRINTGLYTEVEANLSKRLMAKLASRFEHYADFGNNFSWKAALRYRLSERVSTRLTFNTGFRAPSMPQIYFSSQSIQFISVGEEMKGVRVVHANHGSSLVRLFDVAPLKAEISNNWSAGITARLNANFSFMLDAYDIYIKDRIVLTSRIGQNDSPHFKAIMEPLGISRIQFFTNAVSTQTSGFDIVLKYKTRLGKGHLKAYAGYNKSVTKVKKIALPGSLSAYGKQLFNREEIARLELAQPKTKTLLGINYTWKKWQWNVKASRFGAAAYIHPDDEYSQNWLTNEITGKKESRDQIFSPKWTTDVSIAWKANSWFNLMIAGSNIFNIYPDEHTHSSNINHGNFRYSRHVQQFGVRGAYWSVTGRLII